MTLTPAKHHQVRMPHSKFRGRASLLANPTRHQATVSMVRCGCCKTSLAPSSVHFSCWVQLLQDAHSAPVCKSLAGNVSSPAARFSSALVPHSYTEINTPTSLRSHDALWEFSSRCFTVAEPAGFDLWLSIFMYSTVCAWMFGTYCKWRWSRWNPACHEIIAETVLTQLPAANTCNVFCV